MNTDEFVIDAEPQKAEETITLTRAELDALTAYDEKLRREAIKKVFDDMEELLHSSFKIESSWASLCKNADDRGNYLYGANLCTKLLIDLQAIKRRYATGGDEK
jgi:hypothetical protein